MGRYILNIHKKPMVNKQDRQKITFPGSAYPKISQQYTPATHTEAVHCQMVLLGVFHPYLWPPKAPGSTLGGGSPNLSSAHWRQYPLLLEYIRDFWTPVWSISKFCCLAFCAN